MVNYVELTTLLTSVTTTTTKREREREREREHSFGHPTNVQLVSGSGVKVK